MTKNNAQNNKQNAAQQPGNAQNGKQNAVPDATQNTTQKPQQGQKTPVGGLVLGEGPIEFNEGRKTVTLKVHNTGDRPIQGGSHFHFFEVNRALEFDRPAAYGMRLNISSTTAIRFEPGDEKTVSLVAIGGTSGTYGFNNLVDGWTGDDHERVLNQERADKLGFKNAKL